MINKLLNSKPHEKILLIQAIGSNLVSNKQETKKYKFKTELKLKKCDLQQKYVILQSTFHIIAFFYKKKPY